MHKQDASYLDVIHADPAEWNPTDYAYHLTRRARGLPLWFSLAVYGVRAYSDAIEAAIGLAREAAAEIGARDYLELIREPELGVVLFRRRGWTPAQYTELGRPAAARPGGVHPADGVGGRDRRQVRVPAPAHLDGPGPRDPRPDAVAPRRGAQRACITPRSWVLC